MNHNRARPALIIPLFAALLVAGCDAGPTEPRPAAPPEPLFSNRATTTLEEFAFQFGGQAGIGIPAPCLGGTFVIRGPVTGWIRITETHHGHFRATEHWDFSQLTASLGEDTWRAAPGAGEMFSFNLPPLGSAAIRVVHNGRSRFIADGDQPDVFFVHRFHILRLPSGEFRFTRPETEMAAIECIGSNR